MPLKPSETLALDVVVVAVVMGASVGGARSLAGTFILGSGGAPRPDPLSEVSPAQKSIIILTRSYRQGL